MIIFLIISYLNPNHYQPWVAFHADWLAGLAFAPILIWSATQANNYKLPNLAKLGFTLGTLGVIQFFIGTVSYLGDAAIQLCYLTGFGLSVIAGNAVELQIAKTGKNSVAPAVSHGLWIALVFSGILSSGIALYQYFELDYSAIFVMDIVDRGRVYANLAQPNQLATLLSLAIVGCVALCHSKLVQKNVAIFVIFLLTSALSIAKSRSTFLFLIIFFICTIFFKKCKRSGISIFWPLLVIAFFFLLLFLLPLLKDAALLGQGISLADRTDVGSRIGIWKMSIQALRVIPLLGYGAGQIAHAQIATLSENRPLHFVFESSHNLFLDLILNFGIIAGSLSLLMIFYWLIFAARRIRSSEMLLLMLAILTLGAHAMVEFPLNYAYFLLPMGFLLGQMNALLSEERSATLGGSGMERVVKIVFTIIAILLFTLVFFDYMKVESNWRNLRYSLAKIQGSEIDFSARPFIYNQFDDAIYYAINTPKKEMSDEEINRMKISTQRFNLASITFKYAIALALNKRYEDASATLTALCKMQSITTCRMAIQEWKYHSERVWPELLRVDISEATAVARGS